MFRPGGYNKEIARFIYITAKKVGEYGSKPWAKEVAKQLKTVGAQIPKWIEAIIKAI